MNKTIDKLGPTSGLQKNEVPGRRKFVRGVGLALPVTLTVAARSALAGTCFSVSANASLSMVNASRVDRTSDLVCSGKSPATWAGIAASGYPGGNPPFSNIFVGGSTQSMRQVIRDPDRTSFEKYMAAAWCNYAVPLVSDQALSLDQLTRMWAGRVAGNFEPVPGVMWDMAKMMAFLETTWSAP